MQIYLFEVVAAVDADGTEETLYFAHGKAYKHPSAPAYYSDRIVNPINIQVGISSDLRTTGDAKVDAGVVVIGNADGLYDYLLNYGYGRRARVLKIDSDAAYDTAVTVISGYVEQPTCTEAEISFRFRDMKQELRSPFQAARFSGTNIGATGLEGLPDDIGGLVKPRIFGKALNILPVLLNKAQLIYGWNFDRTGEPASTYQIPAVRDGAVALTYGSDYGTVAELQASVPDAGTYNTCIASSMLKLGSKAVFDLTMDVVEGSASEANKIAHLVERILLDAGIPEERIDAGALADFHALASYTAGYYAREDIQTEEVINALMDSAGGFLIPNGAGVYELVQLKNPAGTPAITFRMASKVEKLAAGDASIMTLQRVAPKDEGSGIPARQINLGYARNWQLQTSFAGSAPAETQERYRGKELKTSIEVNSVTAKYPQAPVLEFSTLLTEQDDAAAECARRATLYCVERAMYEVTAQLTPSLAAALKNGIAARVDRERYGLSGGKNFVITQYDLNARVSSARITLWG